MLKLWLVKKFGFFIDTNFKLVISWNSDTYHITSVPQFPKLSQIM